MEISNSIAVNYPGVVKKAYQAFFSPPKYEVKPEAQAVLEQGKNYRIPVNGSELAVTTWGEGGPTVLLMHGWGGARAQMTGFVEPLLAGGYRVAAYDQPAHGESDGRLTNLLEIAPTMERIQEAEGNFEAILAHSFGTLITSYALVRRNLPAPRRLVYFGAINRLVDSLPRFQEQANLPDEIMNGMEKMLYETFGREKLEAIANERLAPQIDLPALMFHDAADPVTPIDDSRAIANAWERAQLVETAGLGHRGLLQSSKVHQQVVEFLTG
jgi:pimeloyl-ACP methyl ester carboxylesterase